MAQLERGGYGLWGAENLLPAERHLRLLALLGLGLLGLISLVFIAPALLPGVGSTGTHVSKLVYPAAFLRGIDSPTGDAWTIPADAVTVGDDTFVLDTGNNRIFRIGTDGKTIATWDTQLDSANRLQLPMAIATDGKRLFVANSMGAEVLILDLSGKVKKTLALPAGVSGMAARPIGVAVAPDGGIAVSDANNHEVLRYDAQWNVVWKAGTGTRAGGAEGFNVPGAIAFDDGDNLYVVDTLGARVVELSPAGAFLRQFGERGDTVGKLSRPKGVAVDHDGRVFVSDGLLAAVEVFSADGGYLGMIGRRDPRKVNSTSLFVAPAGLSITPDALTVTDRYAGVLTFDLTGHRHAATIPTQAPNVASPTPGYVGTPAHSH